MTASERIKKTHRTPNIPQDREIVVLDYKKVYSSYRFSNMFKYSLLRETSDSMSHFRTKVSLILRFYFLASQLVSLILRPKTQTAPFGWRTRTSDSISKHKNKKTFT